MNRIRSKMSCTTCEREREEGGGEEERVREREREREREGGRERERERERERVGKEREGIVGHSTSNMVGRHEGSEIECQICRQRNG